MQNFDPKKPGETLNVGFDFADVLAPEETLVSATLTVSVLRGVDPSPNDMLKDGPIIIGTLVSQFIRGGLDGVTYLISCTAITSDPQTLINEGVIAVEGNLQTSALFMRAIDVYDFRVNQVAIAGSNFDVLAGLSDAVLWQKLVAAEADLSRRMGIPLVPTEIFYAPPSPAEIAALAGKPYLVEDGYNMPSNFLGIGKFGCFRLRVNPVIEIKSIKLIYPNQAGFSFEIPAGWIRLENKSGLVHLFPSALSVSAPLSIMTLQAITAGYEVPCMIRVRYTAGIDAASGLYPDLMDIAKRMAVLRILHDAFLSSSDSISADGLSQSQSTDLKQMQSNIDDQIDTLKQRLRGVLFDVM